MKVYNISDFGAKGRAVRDRSLFCPARTHAGWRSGADLSAEVYESTESGEAELADTMAIQRAIDEAHAAGGGRVLVPGGNYLIGPIRLRSRVDLHLAAGATLWGVPRLSPYLAAAPTALEQGDPGLVTQEVRRGGMTGRVVQAGLLEAVDCEDVSLSGRGCINQQSGAFFIPWWAGEKAYELERPARMFRFQDCRSVRVENVRIRDSCGWTLVFDRCEDVRVRDVSLRNLHGPNVDGIDVVDSRNVIIDGCDIFTTDDGICLKSYHPEGRMERIRVSGCFIRTLCNGFKIGTETIGHIRDIVVSDLSIYNPEGDLHDASAGIALCCMDGGTIENVSLSNIQIRNARAAFLLVAGRRQVHQKEHRNPRPGVLQEISLSGITAVGAQLPSLISGLQESPVRGLRLNNIQIQAAGGGAAASREIPVLPEAYPSPTMFGELPAAGVYVREVERLAIRDFHLLTSTPAARPTFVFEAARAVELNGSPACSEQAPPFTPRNSLPAFGKKSQTV